MSDNAKNEGFTTQLVVIMTTASGILLLASFAASAAKTPVRIALLQRAWLNKPSFYSGVEQMVAH